MARPAEDDDTRTSAVTTDHGAAGRIEVDRQGNRVWRWARDMIDSTSILLKRLENQDLALEPTQKVPVVPATKPGSPRSANRDTKSAKRNARIELSMAPEADRDSAGGFDPYNSRK
ncbi:MAG TPA: hypothetical protein VFO94_12000 [Gammaproteobacteria bacterium]|jgi:hypothetical protein|nr:hypothetical protein [Gammaproteobacteria bacterium]